jgi:hypothetical protein
LPKKSKVRRVKHHPALPYHEIADFIDELRTQEGIAADALEFLILTAAGYLTANGPAGRIRDAFNALVILPAHQGKDAGKKVRGHSGFMGNADVVLHVEANKKTGAIKVIVEKMRDGRDGFSIFFKVPPMGSTTVPVPEKITEEEYLALIGPTSGGPDGAQLTFNNRRDTLVEHRAVSFDSGLSETQFAEILAGPRPRDDDADALAKWKADVEQERTSLKNAHGKKSYKGELCDQQLPTGSDKTECRWYIVKPCASDTGPMDFDTLFGCPVHGSGVGMQSPAVGLG